MLYSTSKAKWPNHKKKILTKNILINKNIITLVGCVLSIFYSDNYKKFYTNISYKNFINNYFFSNNITLFNYTIFNKLFRLNFIYKNNLNLDIRSFLIFLKVNMKISLITKLNNFYKSKVLYIKSSGSEGIINRIIKDKNIIQIILPSGEYKFFYLFVISLRSEPFGRELRVERLRVEDCALCGE